MMIATREIGSDSSIRNLPTRNLAGVGPVERGPVEPAALIVTEVRPAMR